MPLTPVTFEDFHGGIADKYVGTDITRAQKINNFYLDETAKPIVRYGASIYPARLPFASGSTEPSGIYLGAQPYSHPVIVTGPHAYVVNETAGFSEIKGPNTNFLPTKTDSQLEAAVMWRRQIIAGSPTSNLLPAFIYCTNYVQPGTPANPAVYKALTLGMPALASSPTITGTGSGNTYLYAFYYKYSFVDYTGTLFLFFGNPNLPEILSASNDADPSSASISITNIPALSNTTLTNYDTATSATTNTTFVQGSTSATVVSATGIVLGAQVINSNVPFNTYVLGINGTTITLSNPASSGASGSSTTYATLTVQIYRSINGGTQLFEAGQIANGTTSFTDAMSDTTLQTNGPIYTSGGALGYDQPPTQVVGACQTNDTFWYATSNNLFQSITGAPGACPTSFQNQVNQKVIGLSDIISYPILFCDKAVYRVENLFDSYGNGGFIYRSISETAGCISNKSIVKTPSGLFWFGNGGVFYTDGYQSTKVSRHLSLSYPSWASSTVAGAYDPVLNVVVWTISLSPNAAMNAFLVLHLNYGISEEMTFSTWSSETNIYPTALAFSSALDLQSADVSISTTATYSANSSTITVASSTGIKAGQMITAVGIPYQATVLSVSGTTVTLSQNTNSAESLPVPIIFSQAIFSNFYNRMLTTDYRAYLLWFDPSQTTDPWINTTLSPTQMAKKAIIYDFTTAGFDQGIKGFRQYTPDVSLQIDSQTSAAVQIRHRRDDGGGGWSGDGGSPPAGKGVTGSPGGGSTGNPGVPEIRQDNGITWGVTDCLWANDPTEHQWNDIPILTGKRGVPATMLRSAFRQLKFTNSYTNIVNSDVYGTATVTLGNPSATPPTYPTVSLDNYPTQSWITDCEGYYMTFVGDGYNQTFQIVSRVSGQVLQISDPKGLLTIGSQQWVMKGYRKFERPRILSFTLYADTEGPTYGQAPTTQAGSN